MADKQPDLSALMKRLDDLEAKSTAKDAEIAALRAQLPGGPDVGVDLLKAKLAKERAALMAKTKKTATTALYRVGPEGHYRSGRLYSEGEVVEVPIDEEPHHAWSAVGPDAAPSPVPAAPASAVSTRPSDRNIA